jgi:putative nucleotidyltransferase with HDIG domain
VAITDRSGTIVWSNEAYRHLVGFPTNKRLGQQPLRQHAASRDAQRWNAILAGKMWQGVEAGDHDNGTRYYVEQTITAVGTDEGVASHVVIIAQEVTQRVEQEQFERALATLALALRKTSGQTELQSVLLEQSLALLNANGATLALRDPLTTDVICARSVGSWSHLAGLRVSLEASASGTVLRTGKPYHTADIHWDDTLAHREFLGSTRAVAAVPLQGQSTQLGVLWVGRDQPFTPSELELLNAIAELAGGAIHAATLQEQTEARLRRLSSLQTIDRAIVGSLDLQVTLGTVLEQVVMQLQVDAASVLLLEPHSYLLRYALGRGFRTDAVMTSFVRLGEGLVGLAALERRLIRLPVIPSTDDVFTRGPLLAVEGFVSYFAVPLIAKGQVVGVLEVFHRAPLHTNAEWIHFLEVLAGQAAVAIDNAELFVRLQRSNTELALAYDTTLEGWARALDLRDNETEGHSRRVTDLTVRLAQALGVSESDIAPIRRGALLHDIGKMGVPDAILHKPGALTEEEWTIMRRHPLAAVEMLAPVPFLQSALDIPHYHHERWDGSGYPHGLRGTHIPFAARLFAVVDVWDAMTSDRPYRRALPSAQACAYLKAQAGVLFDPVVVAAFLRLPELFGDRGGVRGAPLTQGSLTNKVEQVLQH